MPWGLKDWGVFRDTLYICSKFILETFPGLEATGNVAKAPAKFTVETFGAGDGDLAITVKGPDGTDYKVDKTFNNDRKKSYSCSYFPDKEGDFTVPILWGGRNIPKSPFNVQIEGFAGDANKVYSTFCSDQLKSGKCKVLPLSYSHSDHF